MNTSSHLKSISSRILSKKQNSVLKKYRRFNFSFIITVFLPLMSVGVFNIAIDPYGVFNTPESRGWNHAKPSKDNNDRVYKAIDVIRIKPVTIFLGSSRIKQGLDPSYPALAKNQSAYNLGLNGVNVYEQLRYLEHAIANQKNLKLVILGTDFFSFNSYLPNPPVFSEDRLEKKHLTLQDTINFGFSLDALLSSRESFVASVNNPHQESHHNHGFSPHQNIDPSQRSWRFNVGINDYFKNHYNYQLSSKYIADFKKIVNICKNNNINLVVFISPSHATQWEAIYATGQGQTFEQWKRELVKITPVWDFSGYNSITTEPITPEMENYTDNSHYTPKIGNLVLNRLLSYQEQKVPKDFGVLVTSNTIESHLAKIRTERDLWVRKHRDEVKLVQDMQHKFETKEKEQLK